MVRQIVQDRKGRGSCRMNGSDTQKQLLIGKLLKCLLPGASRSDEPLYAITVACTISLSDHALLVNRKNDLSCAFTISQ